MSVGADHGNTLNECGIRLVYNVAECRRFSQSLELGSTFIYGVRISFESFSGVRMGLNSIRCVKDALMSSSFRSCFAATALIVIALIATVEQIKFLLGHSSIQTTERYLGSEQDIEIAVNDNLGL